MTKYHFCYRPLPLRTNPTYEIDFNFTPANEINFIDFSVFSSVIMVPKDSYFWSLFHSNLGFALCTSGHSVNCWLAFRAALETMLALCHRGPWHQTTLKVAPAGGPSITMFPFPVQKKTGLLLDWITSQKQAVFTYLWLSHEIDRPLEWGPPLAHHQLDFYFL